MNRTIRLLSAFVMQVSAFAALSCIVIAQEVPTTSQEKITQKICSFDAVDDLLPSPQIQQTSSPFSYLIKQGFVQNTDGSWVCYVSDPNQELRYYTLFKVQQINGKLVASSFLDNGNLIDGQDNRSLDLFMMLIENHMKTTEGNRQSIRRYLQAFMSLVKQGKIQPLRRGYLFDQPNRAFVLYHPVTGGIQGTAVTININMLQKN